jgi:putative ABC transport system substrate-binding protein
VRPGGNVTGLTTMDWGIYGKRIEILKQVVPDLSKVAMLLSRGNAYKSGSPWAHDVETDARSLGVDLFIVEADHELRSRNCLRGHRRCRSLVGASDEIVVARRREIAESAMTPDSQDFRRRQTEPFAVCTGRNSHHLMKNFAECARIEIRLRK